MASHLLSLVLFLPLAGMLVVLAIPAENFKAHRLSSNVTCALTFFASLLLIFRFNTDASGYQLMERARWIPSIGAQYLLGLDGISLLMVLLTTLITWIACLCSWRSIT